MLLPTTGNPDFAGGGQTTTTAQLVAALLAVDASYGQVQHIAAAGAITVTSGTVFLNTGTAGAISLAAPVAGLPSAGGNDGQSLTIIAIDAEAYVVTAPANAINGSKHIATFGGAVGDSIDLVAYGGVWYQDGTPLGVALT
jgi:hypothetical protein